MTTTAPAYTPCCTSPIPRQPAETVELDLAAMLDAVASWPSLAVVLVVFGVAPGLALRMIVLIYPKENPRRAELLAELRVVPRLERPLWVAEQLEVAVFDGTRVRWRRRRIPPIAVQAEFVVHWMGLAGVVLVTVGALMDAVASNEKWPQRVLAIGTPLLFASLSLVGAVRYWRKARTERPKR